MSEPDTPDTAAHAAEGNATGDPAHSQQSAAQTAEAASPVRRGMPLRRNLLAKLPHLQTRGWAVDHWLNLKPDSDVRAVIDLDADAFLVPLEERVPTDRK